MRSEPSPDDGIGEVRLFRAYERTEAGELVDLVHLVTLPASTTLGRHRHGDDSEWYLILDGSGTMHVDGEELAVRAGDLVTNRPFGEHGLVNDSDGDLRLLVVKTTRNAPGPRRPGRATPPA